MDDRDDPISSAVSARQSASRRLKLKYDTFCTLRHGHFIRFRKNDVETVACPTQQVVLDAPSRLWSSKSVFRESGSWWDRCHRIASPQLRVDFFKINLPPEKKRHRNEVVGFVIDVRLLIFPSRDIHGLARRPDVNSETSISSHLGYKRRCVQ
jgi:hypothetical protein